MNDDLTAVTYIRNSDRTRIIYVLPGDAETAQTRAAELAPRGFKLAAVCQPDPGKEMVVPSDGDDYGDCLEPWWPPLVAFP